MFTSFHIVVLISGHGSNLQALIYQQHHYQISAVISNNPKAYGLLRAQQAHIPTHIINHRDFANREHFDTALMNTIDRYQPHLVALAGFMRHLGSAFVKHYLGKLINIHPSLLPKYPGLQTHQRVLEAKDRYHGCSIHYVNEQLDAGPLIAQAKLRIETNDTVETLQQRIHALEHQLYPLVVCWMAEDRLKWEKGHPKLDNQPLPKTGILLNI